MLEVADYSGGIIPDLWWGYPGAVFLGFVDDSACPLRPGSEELRFFEGVDYGVAGQACPVAVVEDKPDFISLVGGFEAVEIHGLVADGCCVV